MAKQQLRKRKVHPATKLAGRRNWLLGSLQLARSTVERAANQLPILFAGEPPNHEDYDTAKQALTVAATNIRTALMLLRKIFKEHPANEEVLDGKIRHQQVQK
jgi:hypothetical protein